LVAIFTKREIDSMLSQTRPARRIGPLLPCALLLACTSSYFRPKAAESLHCPEDQLQVEEKTAYSSKVTGCGKSDVIVLDGAGALISVRERAAFELSCASDSIEVIVIDPNLYGAAGCGKKITYRHFSGHGITAQAASVSQ
jgi:hypothetical protein